MKRIPLLFVLSLILVVPFVFSFSVTGEGGLERSFFSLNEPIVNVKSTQNISNFSVNYTLLGDTKTDYFNLSSCPEGVCGEFSLVDLFSSFNGTLTGSEEFIIKAGTQEKTITLDIEKPQIVINNSIMNVSSKQIQLEFTISDNSNKIRSLDLFKREAGTDNFITNLNGTNKYNYNFDSEGNLTLVLVAYDEAGNKEESEKSYYIEDYFEPTVKDISYSYNNDKYSLKFTTEDKELERYEISQGTLSVVETLSGKTATKTVELPFSSGEITLRVFDKLGNVKVQKLTLPSLISIKDEKRFSNEKTYSFTSGAKNCVLTKFESTNKNSDFSKSSSQFSINLDVSSNKKYDINFNCVQGILTQYFQKEFTYDTVTPSSTTLNIEKEDNGDLKLTWNESQDSQSDVSYKLIRNDDKKVYEGTKLKYRDSKVEYPTQYSYVVEVYDEAGNIFKSNEVSAIPLKVFVNVDINLKSTQEVVGESFNLKLDTDKNSNVEVTVTNKGKIIFQQYYEKTSNVNEKLSLKEGENLVDVHVVDEFENSFRQSYIINSTKGNVLNTIPKKTNEVKPIIQPAENNTGTKEVVTENGFANYIWFLLILLVFVAFIFYVKNIRLKTKGRKNKRFSRFDKKRKTDNVLESSLKKIQENRFQRDKEKKFLFMKNKNLKQREKSEFEKQKIKDLEENKGKTQVDYSHKKSEIEKRALNEHERAPQTKSRYVPPKKKSLKEKLFGKKQEKPKDEFSAYIMRKRGEQGWDSTKKYRESYQRELEERILEEQREREEEERLKLKRLQQEQELKQRKIDEVKKEKEKPKEPEKFDRRTLDDYLGKRKKKKKFYFAEMFVNRDLKNRNKK